MRANRLPHQLNDPLLIALASQLTESVIILNENFNVLFFNYSAEKLFCCTEKIAIQQPFNKVCLELGVECLIDSLALVRQIGALNISSMIHGVRVIWQIQKVMIDDDNFYLFKSNHDELEEKNKQNEIYQLNTLIENMPCNVYWMDKDCIMMGCNQNVLTMLSLTRDQFYGKSYEELSVLCDWPQGLADKLKKDDLSVIHTGQPIIANEDPPIPNGDGTFSHFLTSRVPLKNQDGEIVGVAGISTEVSALKEAKKKAEAANIAKTEFIANMSHDIRTPLTGVIGVSDMLEKLEANPELKQYAHDIHDCGQQLLGMLNSILDVVSADHVSEQDKKIETFDLHQCIEEIIYLEKPTISVKNLELIVRLSSDVPRLLSNDKTKIHRILLNLFSNAVKFTDKGSITLSVQLLSLQDNQARIRFAVTDTGIGIASEQQAKVFDRFFRASPSYKGQYVGHGVGLHIAQSYAKLLGGEIKLISKEGAGTTFYVDLISPIVVEEKSVKNDSAAVKKQESDSKIDVASLSCLLVEDNLIALKVLESIITGSNIRYQSTMDGESALQLATSQQFDFIITDIGLPGISGTVLTQQYRQWEKNQSMPPIPIVALTAHAQDEKVKKECKQSGIDEVFAKPFSVEILNQLLLNYLQKITLKNKPSPPPTATGGKLGVDLPDTEEQLFQLEHLPLFNIENALSYVGQNKALLTDILKAMAIEEIPRELINLEAAYQSKDWGTIERLAHKMKGGAVYLGTERLKFACQYLERYQKAGHSYSLEALYQQMVYVIKQTCERILQWLNGAA